MVRNLKNVLLGGLLVVLGCSAAQAQQAGYKIERSTFTSGGILEQTTSKGSYTVSGAFSQAVIEDKKSDNYVMKQGFWTVVPGAATSSVTDNFDVKTNGLTNFPNPIKDFTKIQVELPGEAYVSVKIFDVTGNLVMSFDETYFSSEKASFDWRATDTYGNRISSGNYVCEVTARSAAYAGASQFTPFVARKILTVVN